MYSGRMKLINFHRLIIFGVILSCFTGLLLAQTFHYSRGWTNGKRRVPIISGPENDGNENLGLWQIQRFKRLLELSQCCESNLPSYSFELADDNLNRKSNHF